MAKESDFRSRVSEALGALFGETPPRRSEEAPEEPGPLEAAASSIVGFLERRSDGTGFLRFQPGSGRDLIVAPGESVELSVKIDPILGLAAKKVRFRVGKQTAGQATIGPERTAYLPHAPTASGVHRIEYDLLGASGSVLKTSASDDSAVLHVVDGAPTAAVYADLLFEKDDNSLDPLRDLAERGWQLCYVDLDEEDRTHRIRQALGDRRLPEGAVLVHPATDVEFKTLGVDFRKVFATTTLRRIRAAGVPLILLLSDDPAARRLAEVEGVRGADLSGLAGILADKKAVDKLEALAGSFIDQRKKTDSGFAWRLDRMTGTRPAEGNQCRAEFGNRTARENILRAVEQAQRNIHLQFYILKDCRFTESLAVRLISRARAGVKVRLMVDALYSTQELLGLKNRIVEGLSEEPNIQVVAADPIRIMDDLEALRLKQRDHRKLIVIDGESAFVSGRNAGDEYYTGFNEVPITDWTPADRIPWLDAHIELKGPLVAQIQKVFLENWKRNGGAPVKDEEVPYPEAAPPGECSARLVVHDGVSDSNGLAAYEAIIDAARSHLFVINDFPVIASLAAALRRAVGRGVEVNYLTGNAQPRRADGTYFKGGLHRELFDHMIKNRFEILIQNGVRVYEYTTPQIPTIVSRGGVIRPYVHAKVVTADGQIASIGSANLDATASYWEREANVVVENEAFVAEVEADIRQMIGRSFRIDPDSDYWKRGSTQREIVSRLWPDAVVS